MRLHRNLVDAVVDGFLQINNDGLYADKVIERLLKRDKRWGSKDRAFIAETLYELVRYKRLYTEIAQEKAPFTVQSARRVFAVLAFLSGTLRVRQIDVSKGVLMLFLVSVLYVSPCLIG